MEPKDMLLSYLERGREAMLWKLDGLSEYDVRRPMTPTGTNLLGLVKHLASVELGYFGEVTLHRILVHMIAETHRHAGHADILREAIDGAAGMRPDVDNLAELEAGGWRRQYDELQAIAERFRT